MDNMMEPYIVYVLTDSEGRITAVNSSAFVAEPVGWTPIDSGYGDRYHHAQGNYFGDPIYDERGICRYKLAGGQPVERSTEEMDADWVEPQPQPSVQERLDALEAANAELSEQNAMLTECLLEISGLVYA